MMERSDIMEKLQSNRCWVTFKKVNGEMRTMHCTLLEQYLPKQMHTDEVTARKTDSNIAVWDLQKEAWRSFRVDSVVKFEVL